MQLVHKCQIYDLEASCLLMSEREREREREYALPLPRYELEQNCKLVGSQIQSQFARVRAALNARESALLQEVWTGVRPKL